MKRTVTTVVVLFFVSVFFPIQVFADTAPCGATALSASGYFFDSYENIQYSDAGYLIHNFHNLPQYSDGRSFKIRWSYIDDECNSLTSANSFVSVALPAGVVSWSIRFTSGTHFDVWDDQNEVMMASFDIPAVPLYTRISFEGTIDNGGSVFTSQTLHIEKDATPPTFQNSIEKPTPCNAGSASGYYFDFSESAEYVDGLLRVHLRLKTPYNDGRVFRTAVLVGDESCVTSVPSYSSLSPDSSFTPYIRYYSFRMTSSTHFVLWDDENDIALSCTGCAGDISDSTYVSFYGTIDGDASVIQTTPFSPTEFQKCCSSVLFLPGIKGSRLYVESGGAENKLWEPDLLEGNADVRGMFLDSNGKSTGNVYVKEGSILDSAGGKDYYKSFISDMDELKSARAITDWQPVAYDWRLSLDDILANGAEVDGKIFYDTATATPYITQTLRELASQSQTGKVTIVAHSNGGLVTKALLQQLGDTGAQKLVDRVIFVGVPQSGAPQSIGALLYGYKEDISFFPVSVVDKKTAREFAENSPMGYHLLPSQKYFDDTKDINHPVVIFDGEKAFEKERIAYGLVVGNSTELGDFLLARDGGREKPLSNQIGKANVLNSALVDYAKSLHDNLDVWVPPENITLYQIAGWGVGTVAGIEFYDAPQVSAFTALNPRAYRPLFVEDGDGVVPVPSALMMSTSTENVKRYWVNLEDYNSDHKDNPSDHGNILEVPELRQFIKNIFNTTNTLTSYVQTEQPSTLKQAKKLRFFLHSPLTLELFDSSGNHVGYNEDGSFDQEIPDVEYGELGDVQYITAQQGPQYQVVLNGLDVGTFSLDIQEVEENNLMKQTTLANLPTTGNTKVTLSIGDGIETASLLEVDEDGDEVVDITLQPLVGETVIYEEPIVPAETSTQAPVQAGGGGPIWNASVGMVAGTSTIAVFVNLTSTQAHATDTPVENIQVISKKSVQEVARVQEKNSVQKTQTIIQTVTPFRPVSQQRGFSDFILQVYNGFRSSFKFLDFLF
ncbi:alpha/beta hydrolase [Patescibacteria group bacterium]|nr:MAG: alpha/beta hydrolase [Patescibacteria group bacterium]